MTTAFLISTFMVTTSMTTSFLILAFGAALGLSLHALFNTARAHYAQRNFKPALVKRYNPVIDPSIQSTQRPEN